MRRCSVLATAMILAATVAPGARADDTCLRSGTGMVSITGTLIQKVFPGPPNYRSVDSGDAPLLRWLIRLEAAVCVVGDAADEAETSEVSDVRVVQLVLPGETMTRHAELVGKRVTATGFVSTRKTGGQNAVVVLDLKSLTEAR